MHIIDDTCCKQRNCNKCDQYRKKIEKLLKIDGHTIDYYQGTHEAENVISIKELFDYLGN